MGLLDYSALFGVPPPSPVARGVSALGDAVADIHAQRQKAEMERARLAQEAAIAHAVDQRTRDIAAANELGERQRAEMLDTREKAKLALDRSAHQHTALTKDIMPALQAGRADEAAALGAPLGIGVQRQEAPPLPPEPDPVERPNSTPFFGDVMDVAMLRPTVAGAQRLVAGDAQAKQYMADRAEHDQQLKERELARQAAEKNGLTYQISMAEGPSMTYRGNELRLAQEQRGDEAAKAYGTSSKSDLEKQADEQVRVALGNGLIKPEGAAAFRAKFIDDAERRRIAEIAARRPRGGGGGGGLGKERLELAREGQARLLAESVLRGYHYDKGLESLRKSQDMAASLSQRNAALDARAAGTFVKEAQGGTGVVSNQDIDVFWNRIGGVSDRSWTWVQGVLDGTIPSDKRAKVADAVRWLADRGVSRMGEIRTGLSTAFKKSKNLSAYHDQFVDTFFGPSTAAPAEPKATKTDDDMLKKFGY